MARNLRAEVCVGAAIFRGPELLLIRRRKDLRAFPGTWDIPGGHVEQGESISEALRREVIEETGLSIRLGAPFHSALFDYPVGRGRSVPTIEIDFLCRPQTRARPRLNPAEHTEFAWVRQDDAPDYPTTELLTRIIRAAFSTKPGSRS
ncbi:MAG TPA: NUDIX domain-containing protein [Thermoplasmata archaeon]|nr:NUDIX domain-containing protein [Thermoplasmata archaeon]